MIQNKWTKRALGVCAIIMIALVIGGEANASQDVVPNPTGDQRVACGPGFTYDLADLNLNSDNEPTSRDFKVHPVIGCGLNFGPVALDTEVNIQNGDGFLHSLHGGITGRVNERLNLRLSGGLKSYTAGAFGENFDKDQWFVSGGASFGF